MDLGHKSTDAVVASTLLSCSSRTLCRLALPLSYSWSLLFDCCGYTARGGRFVPISYTGSSWYGDLSNSTDLLGSPTDILVLTSRAALWSSSASKLPCLPFGHYHLHREQRPLWLQQLYRLLMLWFSTCSLQASIPDLLDHLTLWYLTWHSPCFSMPFRPGLFGCVRNPRELQPYSQSVWLPKFWFSA